MSCADVGVGTSTIAISASQPFLSSTPIKRPRKRARLELEEEEEENPLECSSSMDFPDPKDSTYDPEDSVTVESADVTRADKKDRHFPLCRTDIPTLSVLQKMGQPANSGKHTCRKPPAISCSIHHGCIFLQT